MRRITVYQSKVRGRLVWRADLLDPRDGKKKTRLPFVGSEIPPSKQNKRLATQEAKLLLARWDAEAVELRQKQEERQRRAGATTFVELIEAACHDEGVPRVGERRSPATIERRGGILRKFESFVVDTERDDLLAEEITPRIVDLYVTRKLNKTKPRTQDRELVQIRRAFNFARQKGLVAEAFKNPVTKEIRTRRPAQQREDVRKKAFTTDELDRIFAACRDGYAVTRHVERRSHTGDGSILRYAIEQQYRPVEWFADFCVVAFETGCRPQEIREVRWDAIDFEGGMIEIRHATSKTGAREVPMTSACRAVLERRAKGRDSVFVFTRTGMVWRWRRVSQRSSSGGLSVILG